jgi:Fe-S cluster assembly ATPase SufC
MDSRMCTLWVAGRIVRSGRKELALELEERGYDWAREEAAEPVLR